MEEISRQLGGDSIISSRLEDSPPSFLASRRSPADPPRRPRLALPPCTFDTLPIVGGIVSAGGRVIASLPRKTETSPPSQREREDGSAGGREGGRESGRRRALAGIRTSDRNFHYVRISGRQYRAAMENVSPFRIAPAKRRSAGASSHSGRMHFETPRYYLSQLLSSSRAIYWKSS